MSILRKVGVVVILLVLIVGSLAQVYDTFNDNPAQDHDALLHTVDALVCVILIVALAGLWTFLLAVIRLIESSPDTSQSWSPRSAARALYLNPFDASPPPLRI